MAYVAVFARSQGLSVGGLRQRPEKAVAKMRFIAALPMVLRGDGLDGRMGLESAAGGLLQGGAAAVFLAIAHQDHDAARRRAIVLTKEVSSPGDSVKHRSFAARLHSRHGMHDVFWICRGRLHQPDLFVEGDQHGGIVRTQYVFEETSQRRAFKVEIRGHGSADIEQQRDTQGQVRAALKECHRVLPFAVVEHGQVRWREVFNKSSLVIGDTEDDADFANLLGNDQRREGGRRATQLRGSEGRKSGYGTDEVAGEAGCLGKNWIYEW